MDQTCEFPTPPTIPGPFPPPRRGRGAPAPARLHLEDPAGVWGAFSVSTSPPTAALAGGVGATGRWRIGRGEAALPAMSSHVLILHHRGAADGAWETRDACVRARLGPSVVSLIPAGSAGRWSVSGELEVSHLYLPEARVRFAARAAGAPQRVRLPCKLGLHDPGLVAFLELLADHATWGDLASRMVAEQCVDRICRRLVMEHARTAADGPRRGLADWQLRRVAAFVQDRLDQAIALADLAGLVGLSRYHFCTAFRRATGETPHDWLTGLRMDRAADLLADRTLPITQIALEVGYETPSSFSARFKRRMGLTPSEFRQRLT